MERQNSLLRKDLERHKLSADELSQEVICFLLILCYWLHYTLIELSISVISRECIVRVEPLIQEVFGLHDLMNDFIPAWKPV